MLLTLAAYIHDLNPYAIRLGDGVGIRWYGLSYLLGFLAAYLLIKRVTVVSRSSLKPADVADFVVVVAIGVVVGGRLGYLAFYDIKLLWTFGDSFPWWGLLALNRGGMASHGGMIGAVLAAWYYARRRKHGLAHLLDLMAFATPLGLFFGRLANFVNGELYGVKCSPDLAWAVKFPQEMGHWDATQLAKLTEAIRPLRPALGVTDTAWAHDQIPWVIDQIQSGNQVVRDAVAPLITPRHPSQLYEAVLEGLVVFIVLLLVWARPKKPLVVGCVFFIVYALARILSECFREPDAHIGYQLWGTTRGQWLSAGLLLVGAVMLVVSQRRAAAPMGGWLRVAGAAEERTESGKSANTGGHRRRGKHAHNKD